MSDRPTMALQENLLAILCFNDKHGGTLANLLNVELFEGEYRVIAERVLDYWKRFNKAPKIHTADLIAELLEERKNRRAPMLRQLLTDLATLAKDVSIEYVMGAATKFTRLQRFKQTILQAGQRINAKEDLALEEVEQMFADMLSQRELSFKVGLRLDDYDVMFELMERRSNEFSSGIPYLDKRAIVPMRGTIMNMIGRKGIGKSWFLTGVCKRALMKRQKVVYLSLELDAGLVLQRTYQSLFAIPLKSEEFYQHSKLMFDADGKLNGLDIKEYHPEFTLRSSGARDELSSRIQNLIATNLVIERFPTRQLTINGIRIYLDNLETTERFVPDILVIDYPALLKIDPKNLRIDLGRTIEDLRGLLVERNIAGVIVHQSSRQGAKARTTRATHSAEDWSVIQTSDTVFTISATDQERRLGLARLYVEHAREAADRFGLLITQDYTIGQFCLECIPFPDSYFDLLKKEHGIDIKETDEDHEGQFIHTGE